MTHSGAPTDSAAARFSRFESVQWWDQSRLRDAKVLVVGAGALGNEVLKNLGLLGLGHVMIVDHDRIEASNLSRSVLFRAPDTGAPKAQVAARAVREIYPEANVHSLVANVMSDVGLGCFRWADIVVGAVDNREARVFINRASAEVGRPWVDGGLDVLNGVVRGFAPPETACYECTMSQIDWDLLNARRSCTLLARLAARDHGVPTTPTTASIIGGLMAQELVKMLHGLESLRGRGFVFEGLAHQSYAVQYPVAPHCPWHDQPAPILEATDWSWDTPLAHIAALGRRELGGLDAIDLPREIVEGLECPACNRHRQVFEPLERIVESDAVCAACSGECVPRFLHSLSPESKGLEMTVRQLGLPRWEVLWARFEGRVVGIELSADRTAVLRDARAAAPTGRGSRD